MLLSTRDRHEGINLSRGECQYIDCQEVEVNQKCSRVPDQSVTLPKSEADLEHLAQDGDMDQAFRVVVGTLPIARVAVVVACTEDAGVGRHVACPALVGRVNKEDRSG